MIANALKFKISNQKKIFPNPFLLNNGTKLVKKTILIQMYVNYAKNEDKNIFYSHFGKIGEKFSAWSCQLDLLCAPYKEIWLETVSKISIFEK